MSQSKSQLHILLEQAGEEIQFDPVKHRQDWLKRLAGELDKIEPLMPVKLLPDGIEYPRWLLNVEREFSLVMLPAAKLKEPDIKMTPKRMGALLGHMCEMAVWTMEWLNFQIESPVEKTEKPSTEETLTEAECKKGQEILTSLPYCNSAMQLLTTHPFG